MSGSKRVTIERGILTRHEEDEFYRLGRHENMTFLDCIRAVGVPTSIFLGASISLFAVLIGSEPDYVVGIVTGMLVACAAYAFAAVSLGKAWLLGRQEEYLRRINYRRRLRDHCAGHSSSSDEDYHSDGNKSVRRQQHEWYGDHTEMNWRDRIGAQRNGMDADMWASNFRESE